MSYHRADIADADAVRAVVTEAEQRTGRKLAGVLHMAGADTRPLWQDTGVNSKVAAGISEPRAFS